MGKASTSNTTSPGPGAPTSGTSTQRTPSSGRPYFSSTACFIAPSDLQHFGAGSGLELAGVDGHRQHRVVTDGPGELDEAVVAEPLAQRGGGGVVDPMAAHQRARELDDLRVLRRHAAAVVLADGGDGRLRHAEPARAA